MMWKSICGIIILVIQVGLCLSTKTGCPAPEDIYPCRCSNESRFGPTLKCEHISSEESLKSAFHNCKGYKFFSVTVGNSRLQYLPDNLFEVQILRQLTLEFLKLDHIFDRQPTVSQHLVHLLIKGVTVKRGSFSEIVKPLKSLETLSVEDMPLDAIGKEFIQYVPKNIIGLYFNRTETKTIEPGTFDNLKNLNILSIINSSIGELTRDLFPTPFNVDTLAFERLGLTKIPEGLFSNMPNLMILSLSSNQIANIPENAFDSNFRLSLFYLYDNPIKCDCRFKWLLNYTTTLYGKCMSPKWLMGKSLNGLSKYDFQC